jgi:hypothetical protein
MLIKWTMPTASVIIYISSANAIISTNADIFLSGPCHIIGYTRLELSKFGSLGSPSRNSTSRRTNTKGLRQEFDSGPDKAGTNSLNSTRN